MGQKVNPKIFRMGQSQDWNSRWFSDKHYVKFLREDTSIKDFLTKELKEAAVARIEIERSANNLTIVIHSAKPGIIIGRGGQGIEDLKKKIQKNCIGNKKPLNVNIQEVSDATTNATLIGQAMSADIEKRIPFRRVMKQAIYKVEKAGAKGVKVLISGRLNGAEIARSESLISGSLPLHTLRADIDYAFTKANTTYGVIGIKVWVYKGEKFQSEKREERKPSKNFRKPKPVAKKEDNKKEDNKKVSK